MGEIAELVLEGVLCHVCGSFIDEAYKGYPRACNECKEQNEA
jgi:DNA-directed RNA polymerase subunit N (RpoN/RPB10)